MKVLTADDDPEIRGFLKRCLAGWGYEVAEACNGAEAWAALRGADPPKVVVLDWEMPELDGLEVCRRLRRSEDMPYVYTIILTGKGEQEDVVEALDAGADDYLLKPFNLEELRSRIAVGVRVAGYEAILDEADAQLRRRLRELEASRASFRSIVQKSREAIVVVDSERTVRFANDAATGLLAWRLDSAIPAGVELDPRSGARAEVALCGGGTGEATVAETEWAGRSAFLLIVRDITARKRIEGELRRAMEAAKSATVAKSRLLANTSHELRTPLNSIIGFSSVLLRNKNGNLRDAELDLLGRIRKNGRHLLGLIDDLLDLSRVEAGHAELDETDVALDALVTETVAEFENRAAETGVRLEAEIPARVAVRRLDEQKMRQVLLNLVGNALKFTEQGRVLVRLRTERETGVPLAIEVSDTGIGIAPGELDRIFEAFGQADTTDRRRHGGTGLGLTISSALLKLMGCRLEVVSTVGEGSTFTVVLPESGRAAACAERQESKRDTQSSP